MGPEVFEFVAYWETDLLPAGRKNFFVGDTITVPAVPTVHISVSDDDTFLSGDTVTSEIADDTTGQVASVLDSDGQEVGNGGKIYGEVFYWVVDPAGNRYMLVEIEQEDALGDYFAFHLDYGIPDPGLELFVESKRDVKDKTVIIEYSDFAAPQKQPEPEPEAEPEPEPLFKFTAFNEFDLTTGGRENLFVGHTIIMPTDPTLLISVSDDDNFLSGDNLRSEYSDDEIGQTATVTTKDAKEVGNSGQIFGECFYWVRDEAGQRYMMIEIEQEGSEDDYFTFHLEYGIPEANMVLFVEEKRNIKENTLLPEYSNLSAGDVGAVGVSASSDFETMF